MQQCIASFPDGVEAELAIYVPWWSWIYLGLIDQPILARVRVYLKVEDKRLQWYRSWFNDQDIFAKQAVDANISINTIVWQSRRAGQQLIDAGTQTCSDVSSFTRVTHRIWFLHPPWSEGATIQGIGYNVLVQKNTESISIQCHIGKKEHLPETHICQ